MLRDIACQTRTYRRPVGVELLKICKARVPSRVSSRSNRTSGIRVIKAQRPCEHEIQESTNGNKHVLRTEALAFGASIGAYLSFAGCTLADEVAEASTQASPLQYAIALTPGILYLAFAYFRGDFSSVSAKASHILVPTEEQALALKVELDGGADFAELAKANSTCPSGQRGGSLGEFKPGQMVKEFNDVVFNDEVGVVHGPVETQFGYHLIKIDERTS